jgi:hypothetical protein
MVVVVVREKKKLKEKKKKLNKNKLRTGNHVKVSDVDQLERV